MFTGRNISSSISKRNSFRFSMKGSFFTEVLKYTSRYNYG